MSHYKEYIELGFNPSTILITCDLYNQFKLEYIQRGGKIKLAFIKSYKTYNLNSQLFIHYFSPKHDVIIQDEIIVNENSLISMSTLRFVDISLNPNSQVYNEILKALVLNPIIIKGAVDNLSFKREDFLFGLGIGEGVAKFNNFKPTYACIIGSLGRLAFLSLYNRYLLGYINLKNNIEYIEQEKNKLMKEATIIYKELGEVIKSNEDNLVYAEEIGKSNVIEKFKKIGLKSIPVYDDKIVKIASTLMKNPFATPFLALVLGNKTGIDEVCSKAISLGLKAYMIKV